MRKSLLRLTFLLNYILLRFFSYSRASLLLAGVTGSKLTSDGYSVFSGGLYSIILGSY